MQGINTWSYAPYKPYFHEVGDIYVCRLAPGKDHCVIEWLGSAETEYRVLLGRKDENARETVWTGKGNACTLNGLEEGVDYECQVVSGEKKSRVRLFRTGEVEGSVVNYLHPLDDAYVFSGRYLCSPSLLRHPDGYLLASMDVFAGGEPQNLTLIFRSDDEGKTWHYVSELMPCFWGRMFIHRGILYMLACSTEYGDLLIGRSEDGGRTFSAPVALLRGSNGKAKHTGVHKNPQPPVEYNGRLYGTLEWGSWGEWYHAPMVMSMDVNDDPMDPRSWHFTDPVKYDENWSGVAQGPSSGNIEGTLAVSPEGKLYNIMRYDMHKTTPNYGLVLAYNVDLQDPDKPLSYEKAIVFPANHSKFTIRRDEQTGWYITLCTRITGPEHTGDRTLLSLMVSRDLDHWYLVRDLLDRREEDPKEVGFQYTDFFLEGDDLLYLVRTSLNGAHNYHDANYSVFHRLSDYRKVIADSGLSVDR